LVWTFFKWASIAMALTMAWPGIYLFSLFWN